MGHHGDVHVVHDAELDELRLASQELELALAPKFVAVLDLDELLGRDGEERHAACQVFEHAGRLKAHGNGEQRTDLRVMPAGVDGVGLGVGKRVAGNDERVELSEHSDGRA